MGVRIPDDGRVVVSACLAGVACTHEAQPKTRDWAVQLVAEGRAVLVCPEVAGGLPIPRPAAEIVGGVGQDVLEGRAHVVDEHGSVVTTQFMGGARKAAAAARAAGATLAVLKSRSPSCGCGSVYDGTFSGTLAEGDGVTAALLKRDGLDVISDEEVEG